MTRLKNRRVLRIAAIVLAGSLAITACSGGTTTPDSTGDGAGDSSSPSEPVTLTWYMGAGVPDDIATAEKLAEDFSAANPDIKIEVDASGPAGVELDAQIRTKLTTGDMADLFWYNSGALMLQLNPDQSLLNVGSEPWVGNLNDAYRQTVSTDAGTYGAPVGSGMGGGFFYNIDVYEELGLTVPKTWDQFMANGEKIRAAGVDPVIQSFGDTWTSQMIFLADYYNVETAEPGFATKLTANEVSFAGSATASAGFSKLQDLADAKYFNEDFSTTLLDQALAKLVEGEGAHYPILTFAQATITQNYPDKADSIGFFPVPGDSEDAYGLTAWMPSSVYAPATTEHPDQVKKFMAFVASQDGCSSITAARGVTGPYVVQGCEVEGDVSRIVSDMLPFFEENKTVPALEFLSPVKGPNLQQITVEVGSGMSDAATAAKAYDDDNKLQAQQLGLEGW